MVDSGSFRTSHNLQTSKHFENIKHDVLLSGASKGAGPVRRHIDPSVDLGRLDVCFGGFSPTVMRDISETYDGLLRIQEAYNERRQASEAAKRVAASRKSDANTFVDGNGASWKYSVLDEHETCIEGVDCEDGLVELAIPETIEDMPVVALSEESCSKLANVEHIHVPDTVVSIGSYAFRDCSSLKRIDYPSNLEKYDPNWTRGCSKLEEIVLPGLLDKITPSVFDSSNLKKLTIGAGTHTVMPGAFVKSSLESIEVNPENEYLGSDGFALYSKDGVAMLALAVPTTEYEIQDGCKALAKKAFSTFETVEKVSFPSTLELIGDYSLSKTGITEFRAPVALKAIGERAFFACSKLAMVSLDDGLLSIGNNAFTDTAITELRIPSSILELGNPLAAGTSLTFSGKGATFSIDKGEDQLMSIDEGGAIYFKADDGLHLVRMLDPDATSYSLNSDTVAIDENAFAKHASITSVKLNEGLKAIGKGAFKGARNLAKVDLPSTLELIDDEAFLDTSLERLEIPAALTRIGSVALITYGAHHGSVEPTLRHIDVDSENPKYYMEDGLLIEHMDGGKDRVILCTGEVPDVVIPDSVTAIASYAFNGVRRLRSLVASDKIVAIDVRGLAFDSLLELIRIELQEPVSGHDYFEFRYPETSRAAQQMKLAFGSPSFINIETIFDSYDNSIVSRTGFGGAAEDGKLGAYEQGKRIVARLNEPLFMSPTARGLMESALRSHIEEICIDIAKHDDKEVIEGLLDLGYINDDNIDDIINAVGRIQDASITNYLLEEKRKRFGISVLDFEL